MHEYDVFDLRSTFSASHLKTKRKLTFRVDAKQRNVVTAYVKVFLDSFVKTVCRFTGENIRYYAYDKNARRLFSSLPQSVDVVEKRTRSPCE